MIPHAIIYEQYKRIRRVVTFRFLSVCFSCFSEGRGPVTGRAAILLDQLVLISCNIIQPVIIVCVYHWSYYSYS